MNSVKKFFMLIGSAVMAASLFTGCPSGGGPGYPSMTLVLSFSGTSAASATKAVLTYGSSSDESVTEILTASVSASKATFTLNGNLKNSSGWLKIYGLSVYSGDTLLSSAISGSDPWFEFKEDFSKTISYTLSPLSSDKIDMEDLSVELDENFLRGFDASYVDWYEKDCNVVFKDTDGTDKDFFKILAGHGVNTVRLRIWNDPSQFSSSVNGGMNDLERTVRMARRVKEAGLSLMLDFHYSDTFADPGRQIVPAAWRNLKSADEVADALRGYTTEVLSAIKNQAGITPSYVQVGNEINPGMMIHKEGKSKSDNTASGSFAYAGTSGSSAANLVKYLSAGADAVHDFDPKIKVVIHLASASNGGDLSWFFNRIKDVDYDVIGLSYYPWESSHGTIASLKKNISSLKSTFKKDVIVAECSAHWKDDSDKSAQNYTWQHMKDPATGSVYSDLTTATSGSKTYVVGSVQNQANVIRHIIEETAASGGTGVFTWGGDLYGNYKWGMFDGSGVALGSMDVLGISSGSGNGAEDTDYALGTTVDYKADGKLSLFAPAKLFAEASSITVSVTDADWLSCGEKYRWLGIYSGVASDGSWTNEVAIINYNYSGASGSEISFGSVTLSSSSSDEKSAAFSAIKANGLYIAGESGLTAKVKVTAE
ncbi:MAG: glycosyl hydrolase 53 family protein [Treponema sp.]|nr:glycosyl hydrolase 53 family protein [Treponema sp.]